MREMENDVDEGVEGWQEMNLQNVSSLTATVDSVQLVYLQPFLYKCKDYYDGHMTLSDLVFKAQENPPSSSSFSSPQRSLSSSSENMKKGEHSALRNSTQEYSFTRAGDVGDGVEEEGTEEDSYLQGDASVSVFRRTACSLLFLLRVLQTTRTPHHHHHHHHHRPQILLYQ